MGEKIDFDSEFVLQHLTNDYLKVLFELEFITSEFQFKGIKINGSEFNDKMQYLRIDGLAFDTKTNEFVIIEYKNTLNLQVLDQAKNYYYNLIETFDGTFKEDSEKDLEKEYSESLQENMEELCKMYKEKFKEDYKVEDGRLKARVMLIGPDFQENIENENPGFEYEVYKATLYKFNEINGYVSYEGVSDKYFNKNLHVNLGNLKLTICTLLNDKSDEIKGLYKNFENTLLNQLNDLDIKYLVDAVSIQAHNEYICLVNVKKSIKIYFYTKGLDEINEKLKKDNCIKENLRDISGISTGGELACYELTLTPEEIEYAIDLINKIYNAKKEE